MTWFTRRESLPRDGDGAHNATGALTCDRQATGRSGRSPGGNIYRTLTFGPGSPASMKQYLANPIPVSTCNAICSLRALSFSPV